MNFDLQREMTKPKQKKTNTKKTAEHNSLMTTMLDYTNEKKKQKATNIIINLSINSVICQYVIFFHKYQKKTKNVNILSKKNQMFMYDNIIIYAIFMIIIIPPHHR